MEDWRRAATRYDRGSASISAALAVEVTACFWTTRLGRYPKDLPFANFAHRQVFYLGRSGGHGQAP